MTWKCIDIEGLSLHERRATFNTKDGGLILAGRYADVFDDSDFEHTGDDGKTLNKVAWRLNQYYISGIASCLATRELLEMLESEQAVTRDLAKRTHGRGTARSSLKLRDQVFGTSLDIAAITRDVQMLTSDRRWYGRDVLDFEQCWRPPREAEAIRLVESLRKQQRRTARRLATEDRQLRDILQMGATLAATATNIRTERWALVAAVLSLVVAVGALLLTLAST